MEVQRNDIILGRTQREAMWRVWENVMALEGNEGRFLLVGPTLGMMVKWVNIVSGTSSISGFKNSPLEVSPHPGKTNDSDIQGFFCGSTPPQCAFPHTPPLTMNAS